MLQYFIGQSLVEVWCYISYVVALEGLGEVDNWHHSLGKMGWWGVVLRGKDSEEAPPGPAEPSLQRSATSRCFGWRWAVSPAWGICIEFLNPNKGGWHPWWTVIVSSWMICILVPFDSALLHPKHLLKYLTVASQSSIPLAKADRTTRRGRTGAWCGCWTSLHGQTLRLVWASTRVFCWKQAVFQAFSGLGGATYHDKRSK